MRRSRYRSGIKASKTAAIFRPPDVITAEIMDLEAALQQFAAIAAALKK
jgi:hypothetical protein